MRALLRGMRGSADGNRCAARGSGLRDAHFRRSGAPLCRSFVEFIYRIWSVFFPRAVAFSTYPGVFHALRRKIHRHPESNAQLVNRDNSLTKPLRPLHFPRLSARIVEKLSTYPQVFPQVGAVENGGKPCRIHRAGGWPSGAAPARLHGKGCGKRGFTDELHSGTGANVESCDRGLPNADPEGEL